MDKEKKFSEKRFRTILIILVVGFVILGGIVGYFAFYYYNQYNLLKSNPQALTASQTKQVISEVSQLMQLPTDETPQVATVVNPSQVQENTPFKDTESGDVILIYVKARRAILYRPTTNKIIDVAPVIIGYP